MLADALNRKLLIAGGGGGEIACTSSRNAKANANVGNVLAADDDYAVLCDRELELLDYMGQWSVWRV